MELMKVSNKGVDLIKKYEGCRLQAYKPVLGEKYWTIGIGHYGKDVKQDERITMERALELFHNDIVPIEKVINGLNINFKQNQFDALVSWIFNLGVGNFNSSTMKKKILMKANEEEITDQMVKWVNSCGKPLLGLKKRRVDEANLFLGVQLYEIVGVKIVKVK